MKDLRGPTEPASPPAVRLSSAEMAETISHAIAEGLFANSNDAIVFVDLTRLEQMLVSLRAAFPRDTLHAIAVKANPTVEILKRIRAAGNGAEVASIGEMHLALAAGFPVDMILFDSPAKTSSEIEFALRTGVRINANTIRELDRIAPLRERLGSRSQIGIRINPETGRGAIEATSVAVPTSKFGVSLRLARSDIVRALSSHSWLTGLHIHIGSQGMSLEQLLCGVGAVYDFYTDVAPNADLCTFNIGGGLPAKYRDADRPVGFPEYASALRARCPALFSGAISLATEFGRAVHASCGWVASRIEYVLDHGDELPTLVLHVGADMFVRKAYRPEDWHHDFTVCDARGRRRDGAPKHFRVAGPLCFAGDYLERRVALPEDVREGDYLLIHDAGAYTFSMWSMYNSRQFPAIFGYEGGRTFHCLRPRQTAEDVVRFWSAGGVA